MGWLVQAEAHPGALFRAFRKVILDRPQAPQLQGEGFSWGWACRLAANLGPENVKQKKEIQRFMSFFSEIRLLLSKKLMFDVN